METERASRLAWAIWTACMAFWVAGIVLYLLNTAHPSDAFDPDLVLAPGFATIGALLFSRQPDNKVGWLFLIVGAVAAFKGFLFGYAFYSFVTIDRGLPAANWAAWLQDWMWPLFFGLFGALLLLFPDGHLPTRRWRFAAWALGISTFGIVCVGWLSTAPLNLSLARVPNPTAAPSLRPVADVATAVILPFGLGGFLAALVAPIVRWRRAAGDERAQLKWLAFVIGALLVTGTVSVILFAVGQKTAGDLLSLIAILIVPVGIPLAVGIAILKYRLYEIDTLIRRSVVFGLLGAFITLVYVAIVVGVGALIGNERNVFLSIVATAVIAVGFQPIRERARRIADRLVYGERASPYEILAEFAERAAGAYSTDDVLPRMARILAEGTGARTATVWVRVGSDLRAAARWPSDAGANGLDRLPFDGETLPEFLGADRAFPSLTAEISSARSP